jgi:hypothetical protein
LGEEQSGTQRTVHVEKLLQLLSSRWLEGGQVAREFIRVEDVSHHCLKTWKFHGKLQALVCCLSEGQQFFNGRIIKRALDAELLLGPAGRSTPQDQDLGELHADSYIADLRRRKAPRARQLEFARCTSLEAYLLTPTFQPATGLILHVGPESRFIESIASVDLTFPWP